MPGTVTLQVDCYREAGDVRGEDLSMNRQGSDTSAKALRSNARAINPFQNFPFQLRHLPSEDIPYANTSSLLSAHCRGTAIRLG